MFVEHVFNPGGADRDSMPWDNPISIQQDKKGQVMTRKRVTSHGPDPVVILGMELDEWRYGSCVAHFGVGPGWATLYDIESAHPGRGHATALLIRARDYYKGQGKVVGGSVALSSRMAHLYEKLGIPEYGEE